ncbi:M16 family metallopeptidase [Zavarzinella formosa]|uniref:M16 family metallopeptidase n=1 Tax=Zavarzinella formosa TaxID=360055 RepID=UPI0002F444AB|nr:pitrilysin family protein [Zavarzinella formosa]
MSIRFVLVACLAFIGTAQADDQRILKTAQSLYEGVKQETLPNGLRVYLKPVPGSPVVTTMVGYLVGSADEELTQTGLSHYLEHLMFKGTDKLKPGDIDRVTQRNGGRNNAWTSEDMTMFHFDFAADRWKGALDIEADRMRNLRIDEKHEFEQEKGAVISELDGNEDQPWELENKLMLRPLYGDKTPYGHPVIGDKAHVRAATADVIKKHYDRWYHPNNAVLIIAGGFDEKEAMDLIRAKFGPIPKGDLPPRKPIPKTEPRKEVAREKMTSRFETPRMLMGFNTVTETHDDSPVLDVITLILGEGKICRLQKRLIETDGTCNGVDVSHVSGRYPGWMSFQIELFKSDMRPVETAILEELKKLADEGPTDAELNRVKRSILAKHIFAHESIHELGDTIARGVLTNDMKFVHEYLPLILKVSTADVKRVAKQYLVDAKPAVVDSIPLMVKEEPKAEPKKEKAKAKTSRQYQQKAPANAAGQFDLKAAKTVTLPNGMKVMLLENHRLPMVYIDAKVGRVRMYEPADKNGLAQLMGEMMEEGTKTRDADKITTLMADVGGSFSVGGSGGTVKVLADDTELGLDVLFDCLMNAEFPKDSLASKQEQLLTVLAEENNKPEERGMQAFKTSIYGKHPFGRPSADKKVIQSLTRKDLRQFHRKVFVPNNTVVAVVGDFDTEKVLSFIKKQTEGWKTGKLPKIEQHPLPTPEKFTQTIISDAGAAQLHVFIGQLGVKRNDPDFYKLLVMDNVLGTGPGFTDRLSANLRDRQGLAYTVRATITNNAGEEPGTFTGYIGTFPDKFAEVKDGFMKEIKKIREELPGKEEVEDAKKYLTGSLAFSLTTCDQAASMLHAIDRYKLGADYLEDYRKAVEAVTPEDVRAVATKYLNPEKLTLIAVGAVDAEGKPLKK